LKKLPPEADLVSKISETAYPKKILPIPEENLSLSADVDDYINMLTGSLDDETDNWGTTYENSARIGKEEANEVKSDNEVTPGPENVPSGSEEEVDHDSAPHPVEETNDDSDNDSEPDVEEMPDESDDDGYNDYGRYNEYGERDRGYYYCNGGIRKKKLTNDESYYLSGNRLGELLSGMHTRID